MDRGDVLVDWRLLARLAMLGVLGVYFVRTLIDSGKPQVLDFDARLAVPLGDASFSQVQCCGPRRRWRPPFRS